MTFWAERNGGDSTQGGSANGGGGLSLSATSDLTFDLNGYVCACYFNIQSIGTEEYE